MVNISVPATRTNHNYTNVSFERHRVKTPSLQPSKQILKKLMNRNGVVSQAKPYSVIKEYENYPQTLQNTANPSG